MNTEKLLKEVNKIPQIESSLDSKMNNDELLSIAQLDFNKGKFDQTHMTDEFLAQIAGNTPITGVVSDYSLTNSKFTEKAINIENCSFYPVSGGVKSINLIDKRLFKVGYFIRWDFGDERENASYSASSHIKISGSEKYTISHFNQLAFYDANRNYISGLNPTTIELNKQYTFTTPSNAVYIRCTILNTNINTVQLEKGMGLHDYVPCDILLPFTSLNADVIELLNNKITGVKSKNLFNKSDVTSGKYVRASNGSLGDNASFSASNYILIAGNTNYSISHFNQIAFYDEYKIFISGVDGYNAGNKTITSPLNAKYIRVSILNTVLSNYQLENNTLCTEYESYGLKLPKDLISNVNEEIYSIKKIISKIILSNKTIRIKLIGDSITQGEGGTGFAQDGEEIIPGWNVNTQGHCWANSLKAYFESKFNCVVNNYGTRGRNSNHILTHINTLVKNDDDIVICMIGTNDRNTGTTTLQQLYNNLISIKANVEGRGKQIIFMSSLPASVENETGLWGTKDYHMEDVDNIYNHFARANDIEYISLYKEILRYCEVKNITVDSLLVDGLHPNDTGYDVMFRIISDKLGIGVKRPGATW